MSADDEQSLSSLDGVGDSSSSSTRNQVGKNNPLAMIQDLSIPDFLQPYVKPALVGVVAVVILLGPSTCLRMAVNFLLTIVGVTIGVAFGLGFAMHVYEKFNQWDHLHHHDAENASSDSGSSRKKKMYKKSTASSSGGLLGPASGRSMGNNALLHDGSSYPSLMASAGYIFDGPTVLRGQVLKDDSPFWKPYYPFTDVPIEQQRAIQKMQQVWPSLPAPIHKQLGRFIEHIMRDYVSMWYSKMDPGIDFRPEREKRQDGILRDGQSPAGEDQEEEDKQNEQEQEKNTKENATSAIPPQRRMVYTTFPHRSAPFVENVYGALTIVFGNLAGRVEHLNIFSLALLKWTRVVAHTFRVYRTLRKHALDKAAPGSQQPKELEVAREFLLSGKLHRAVTFGLDVPSLLFADATGTDCGLGDKMNNNHSPLDEKSPQELTDADVLEHRLFCTNLLKDCELDYNRVLAHRIVRALLPRQHFQSSAVSSLVVEIMGICVLSPLMNLFHPNYLNGWIIGGINASKKKKNQEQQQARSSDDEAGSSKKDSAPRSSEGTANESVNDIESHRQASSEAPDLKEESNLASTKDNAVGAEPEPVASMENRSDETADDSADSEMPLQEENDEPELPSISSGAIILTWASSHLAELDEFLKQEKSKKTNDVNWDDPACQKIVVQLVLVIEAALLHGRCKLKGPSSTISEAGSNDSVIDSSDNDEEFESFAQLLMEMTSDIDAFEKKVDALRSSPSASKSQADLSRLETYDPDANEVSTLRTLISTWLHTGQIYRSIGCIIRAHGTLLSNFYHPQAFLAVPKNAVDFSKRMKTLDGVDIMVDTMAVLASPRLDFDVASSETVVPQEGPLKGGRSRLGRLTSGFGVRKEDDSHQTLSTSEMATYNAGSLSVPRFVDFSRNAAFASSLRSERERRMKAWELRKGDEAIKSVFRKGANGEHIELHNQLHNLALMFHSGTHMMVVRDAARKTDSAEDGDDSKVALLTVENVSSRRRIEVPDDDSSFLLKAQVRIRSPLLLAFFSQSVRPLSLSSHLLQPLKLLAVSSS